MEGLTEIQKQEFEKIEDIYICTAIEGNFYYFWNNETQVRIARNPQFDTMIEKFQYYLIQSKNGKGSISPRDSMEFKRYVLNEKGVIDIKAKA